MALPSVTLLHMDGLRLSAKVPSLFLSRSFIASRPGHGGQGRPGRCHNPYYCQTFPCPSSACHSPAAPAAVPVPLIGSRNFAVTDFGFPGAVPPCSRCLIFAVTQGRKLAKHGGDRKSGDRNQGDDGTLKRGSNNRPYLLARLERDRTTRSPASAGPPAHPASPSPPCSRGPPRT